jgi:hypothetical protein
MFQDYKSVIRQGALNALKAYLLEEISQIPEFSNFDVKSDICEKYGENGMADVCGVFTFENVEYQFNFSKTGGEFYSKLPNGEQTTSKSFESLLKKMKKTLKKMNK